MSSTSAPNAKEYQECLSCRIIGTGALGAVGIYALNQSRRHQLGSVVGKRIIAGLGICKSGDLCIAKYSLNIFFHRLSGRELRTMVSKLILTRQTLLTEC